jgi:hypothetical protein
VWGSEFTTKAATPHGDSEEIIPELNGKFVCLMVVRDVLSYAYPYN